MNPRLRAVLDTNVLASGYGYPGSVPSKIVLSGLSGGFSLVLSRYILDELQRILPRIKQGHLTEADIAAILRRLELSAHLVEPAAVQELELRDSADRPVLGTLVASGADYLVTGDKDLLALSPRYPVMTPAEFWARHG